jgi:predicted TPR repeat methyltransferase
LNVVGQVVDGEEFDLVVATNILVYYDRFQQALAMAGIARMMRAGGVFLSNTLLPAQRPAALEYLGRRSVSYSVSGSYGDDVVAYRRR